jgi:hypothetical protein
MNVSIPNVRRYHGLQDIRSLLSAQSHLYQGIGGAVGFV